MVLPCCQISTEPEPLHLSQMSVLSTVSIYRSIVRARLARGCPGSRAQATTSRAEPVLAKHPEPRYSSSPVSSHSRQTQSPSRRSRALRSVGTIVTPQKGQIGGRSSSMRASMRPARPSAASGDGSEDCASAGMTPEVSDVEAGRRRVREPHRRLRFHPRSRWPNASSRAAPARPFRRQAHEIRC
jgi:hypothetical protein